MVFDKMNFKKFYEDLMVTNYLMSRNKMLDFEDFFDFEMPN